MVSSSETYSPFSIVEVAGNHLWGFESVDSLAKNLRKQNEISDVPARYIANRVMEIKREEINSKQMFINRDRI
jgi:hypothetical protein